MNENNIKVPAGLLTSLRQVAGNGPVLITTHDNPDPDGLASGKALAYLLSTWGIGSSLHYGGIISRSENLAMHDLLTPEWEQVFDVEDLTPYSAVAMLDSQPGAGNNSLLQVQTAQIVIDHHHPIRESMDKVPFTDLRPKMGSTSSMLFQYLVTAQVVIPPDLATALFYGLKTDTRSLSRGASGVDRGVYTMLLELLDHQLLGRVEQAGLPKLFYKAVAKALENTMVYGGAVVADLGEMYRPDFGAEMADLLIRLNHASAVLCLGVYNHMLHLSVRTIPLGEDAGEFVQRIILPPGKAGGHGTMAGGQYPVHESQEVSQLIKTFSDRFLKLMGESSAGERLLEG